MSETRPTQPTIVMADLPPDPSRSETANYAALLVATHFGHQVTRNETEALRHRAVDVLKRDDTTPLAFLIAHLRQRLKEIRSGRERSRRQRKRARRQRRRAPWLSRKR